MKKNKKPSKAQLEVENKKRRKIMLATLIPAGAAITAMAVALPLTLVQHNQVEDESIIIVDDKPMTNIYTSRANVEFKFAENVMPANFLATGKRTVFVKAQAVDLGAIVIPDANSVECDEAGFLSVPLKVLKAPDGSTGTVTVHVKLTLSYTDPDGKFVDKEFDVYPQFTIITQEEKEKVVSDKASFVIEGEETELQTIKGIKNATQLEGKTALIIPANCNVESLAPVDGNSELPESIKTIVFQAPTKSIEDEGTATWYNVKNGALVGTSIDTIVFDDYTSKNMIGFEDYALDYDYDKDTGTGSKTHIKNIDLSMWTVSTIKNIDKYAGGYIGQPFYDMKEAFFTWPSAKELTAFKSGVYRIFKSGGLGDDLLKYNDVEPTITYDNHFKCASFGEGNKIIIGTDLSQAWEGTKVMIPEGTTDILPYAFCEYFSDKSVWMSSFPKNVQIIDFANVKTMNSIGQSAFQDGMISAIYNFPEVTGGCALCLYYEGEASTPGQVALNSRIKYISVADGVRTIPYAAFGLIGNLTRCVLPESLEKIDEGAFYFAGYKIMAVSQDALPAVGLSINWPANLNYIGDYAFYQSNIGYIKLTKKLNYLGNYAFRCRQVDHVWGMVTDILSVIDLTDFDTLTSVPSGWQNENIFLEHTFWQSYKVVVTKEGVSLPDSIKTWLNEEGITQTIYPRQLRTLKDSELIWDLTVEGEAHIMGTNVTPSTDPGFVYKLVVPAEYNGIPVTQINASAFYRDWTASDMIMLYSLDLSNATNLKAIGQAAFQYQYTLVGDVRLPDTINKVDTLAFANTGITSVELNAGADGCTIGDGAFVSCNSLAMVKIADNENMGNITLGLNVFVADECLQYVELSPKITGISNNAFRDCSHLWYIDLTRFSDTDTIPTGWATSDGSTETGMFLGAFYHVTGNKDSSQSWKDCEPTYGVLAYNKDCSTFATNFRDFLVNKQKYRQVWTEEGTEGTVISVDQAFVDCYAE